MVGFTRVRGTRDFLPEEEISRAKMIDTIRDTFEDFGFSPLETPALETAGVLLTKSESIREEIYLFRDKGGREIGLRFDHTVPLARVIAANPQLPLPFRRYAIGKVWRYDRPQSGRFREFVQADVDIVGSRDVLADAEVVWAGVTALKRLRTPSFKVLYNSRRLIDGWGKKVGLEGEKLADFVRSVDKWFKIGEEGVREELRTKGLERYLDKFKELFVDVTELPEDNNLLKEAKEELMAFAEYMEVFEVPAVFDPRMVRGLDYYTGLVFETYVRGMESWGSIGSGGRYDSLIGLISGRDVPATGYSIGVDRLFDLFMSEGLVETRKTVTFVYVAPVKRESLPYAIKVLRMLREAGISSETDVMGRDLGRQLDYANKLGIPWAIIVGPREKERKSVRLRDLEKGTERDVPLEELLPTLQNLI